MITAVQWVSSHCDSAQAYRQKCLASLRSSGATLTSDDGCGDGKVGERKRSGEGDEGVELDEHVAEISLSHPFSGATIIHGHLTAKGLNIPLERVKSSLQRVDPIGVSAR